jgi:urocanate hydratase
VTEHSQDVGQAGPADNGSIRSVERALRLLTVVAQGGPDGIGLLEAARAAALAPSTTSRILRTLEGCGFAERRSDGNYGAGAELNRLAGLQATVDPLERVVQPLLDELAQLTGESSYLAVPVDESTAVYARQAPSPHAVRHVSWLGRTLPRAGTALGAALAGTVDARGVAVVEGGVEAGTIAIAAPIRRGGHVIGAINVVGPSFRIDPAAQLTIGSAALSVALRIEAVLGARW